MVQVEEWRRLVSPSYSCKVSPYLVLVHLHLWGLIINCLGRRDSLSRITISSPLSQQAHSPFSTVFPKALGLAPLCNRTIAIDSFGKYDLRSLHKAQMDKEVVLEHFQLAGRLNFEIYNMVHCSSFNRSLFLRERLILDVFAKACLNDRR
jgi:hypothetical protein